MPVFRRWYLPFVALLVGCTRYWYGPTAISVGYLTPPVDDSPVVGDRFTWTWCAPEYEKIEVGFILQQWIVKTGAASAAGVTIERYRVDHWLGRDEDCVSVSGHPVS